jgi:MFS family permease
LRTARRGELERSGLRSARVAVAAAFFAHGAIAGSWATRIPSVKADLGLGEGALGLALLGPALGALLTMPLSGAITARRGSRSITRATLALNAVALVLPVLAPSLLWLFVALVVFGSTGGAMDVAMNAQGVAVERRYERPVLSSFHAVWSVGGFVGALTGSATADQNVAPAMHLSLVAVVLTVAGLVVTARLLPTHADRAVEGPRFARPTGVLAFMGAIAFCAMLAEGAALDWSAVYLRESLASSPAIAAIAVAAFSLGMASGRLVGDRLVARFGATRFVRYASVVAMAGLIAVIAAADPAFGIVGFTILGAGLSSIVPVVFSLAGHTPGIAGAPGIASVATIGYTAFLVGPSLVGGAAELTSLRAALGLVLLLLIAIPPLAHRIESA